MAWRTFKARYAGQCGRCGNDFEQGTMIVWNSSTRYTAHKACPVDYVKTSDVSGDWPMTMDERERFDTDAVS